MGTSLFRCGDCKQIDELIKIKGHPETGLKGTDACVLKNAMRIFYSRAQYVTHLNRDCLQDIVSLFLKVSVDRILR